VNIFDISISIKSQMPVWPGDSSVKINLISDMNAGANANVSHLSFGAHTGTHVDAPHHFIPGGETLEKIPLENFIGEAEVFEFEDVDIITPEDLVVIKPHDHPSRVLFKTRNSQIWAAGNNQFQEDFVALSPEAAQYLVDLHVKLVGIDYLSIAPYKNPSPTHKILLEAGIIALEGIDLSKISAGRYTLYCLPLKIDGIEGAPARAVLVN
jgi:arylformamidase